MCATFSSVIYWQLKSENMVIHPTELDKCVQPLSLYLFCCRPYFRVPYQVSMGMWHNKQIYVTVFFSPLPALHFNYEDNNCIVDVVLLLVLMWVIRYNVWTCYRSRNRGFVDWAFQLIPISRSLHQRCWKGWKADRPGQLRLAGRSQWVSTGPAGEIVEWWCAKGRVET